MAAMTTGNQGKPPPPSRLRRRRNNHNSNCSCSGMGIMSSISNKMMASILSVGLSLCVGIYISLFASVGRRDYGVGLSSMSSSSSSTSSLRPLWALWSMFGGDAFASLASSSLSLSSREALLERYENGPPVTTYVRQIEAAVLTREDVNRIRECLLHSDHHQDNEGERGAEGASSALLWCPPAQSHVGGETAAAPERRRLRDTDLDDDDDTEDDEYNDSEEKKLEPIDSIEDRKKEKKRKRKRKRNKQAMRMKTNFDFDNDNGYGGAGAGENTFPARSAREGSDVADTTAAATRLDYAVMVARLIRSLPSAASAAAAASASSSSSSSSSHSDGTFRNGDSIFESNVGGGASSGDVSGGNIGFGSLSSAIRCAVDPDKVSSLTFHGAAHPPPEQHTEDKERGESGSVRGAVSEGAMVSAATATSKARLSVPNSRNLCTSHTQNLSSWVPPDTYQFAVTSHIDSSLNEYYRSRRYGNRTISSNDNANSFNVPVVHRERWYRWWTYNMARITEPGGWVVIAFVPRQGAGDGRRYWKGVGGGMNKRKKKMNKKNNIGAGAGAGGRGGGGGGVHPGFWKRPEQTLLWRVRPESVSIILPSANYSYVDMGGIGGSGIGVDDDESVGGGAAGKQNGTPKAAASSSVWSLWSEDEDGEDRSDAGGRRRRRDGGSDDNEEGMLARRYHVVMRRTDDAFGRQEALTSSDGDGDSDGDSDSDGGGVVVTQAEGVAAADVIGQAESSTNNEDNYGSNFGISPLSDRNRRRRHPHPCMHVYSEMQTDLDYVRCGFTDKDEREKYRRLMVRKNEEYFGSGWRRRLPKFMIKRWGKKSQQQQKKKKNMKLQQQQ